MKYLVEADAIALLKNLVTALIPFAQAQQVSVYFHAKPEELRIRYHPEEICIALSSLLCRIITFTPQNESVSLSANLVNTTHSFYLQLKIQNTGVDLSRIGEITKSCKFPITVHSKEEGGTSYELQWQMERYPDPSIDNHNPNVNIPPQIRGFYAEIRKRLQSHFTQLEHKISSIAAHSPQDAIFLQKVNAVILAHLDNENFDANYLSKSMAMSRTQLFRRLKNVIQEPPAHYIRCFRLQKSKEMLETSDYSIGEIAFKTGFKSQSHFTRIFRERFGVRPSAFRRHDKKDRNN
ncbi:MAG: helix-turn-helix domain-containing protein [Haliscomenobacter sp.]|uniref:helix-turn-helix domain-containing protein n=1 Tax=Haliscomenobacter sp. TaxID=2717303 RepID=UPI0029AEABE6|nr:helix-turn-helix domain-containing protein [Haliscomenobacter sp.]MDX2066862.1 helix-turn-helix domain-containing protein [Haliscomenobacter sp.]